MAEHKISEVAQQDLIRIYQYGTLQFGEEQADKYFEAFFEKFELIAKRPFAFEPVELIRPNYRNVYQELILSFTESTAIS